jgi:hypothetical protein
LPVGASVTYEHEYILIFRKPPRRTFSDKNLRNRSSFFWEERNVWFSDLWNITGTQQRVHNLNRDRSAAYPIEIPYRLIAMYSIYGDTVLDPFSGTGTTSWAAAALGRNSVSVDIDYGLIDWNASIDLNLKELNNLYVDSRLESHRAFVKDRLDMGKEIKHTNEAYNFPVMTKAEKSLEFLTIDSVMVSGSCNKELEISYSGVSPQPPKL